MCPMIARVGCGVALGRGVVGAALQQAGGGSAGGMPLVALVLGWVWTWWGGVHGSDILFDIFFFPVKLEVCNAGANCSRPNYL